MDRGYESLGMGLDNWQVQGSETIAHQVIIERDLDKKVTQSLHNQNELSCRQVIKEPDQAEEETEESGEDLI